jgi:hypothetical protein
MFLNTEEWVCKLGLYSYEKSIGWLVTSNVLIVFRSMCNVSGHNSFRYRAQLRSLSSKVMKFKVP